MKTDVLIKDLYVENAELIKALYETEAREKSAERELYDKQGQGQALRRVLSRVIPVITRS